MTTDFATMNEYQTVAMRTAKQDTRERMLDHGALGVASEAGEFCETVANLIERGNLDTAHAIEELGDCCWFAAYLCETLGWEVGNVAVSREAGEAAFAVNHGGYSGNQLNITLAALRLSACGGEIASLIKGHLHYGKDLDLAAMATDLGNYLSCIVLCAANLNASLNDLLVANIHKLQNKANGRYKAGAYSAEAAVRREDKQDFAATPTQELMEGGPDSNYTNQDTK
jgi:NTP pyrophosphatase (non-canonical NTP hydrolase)